MITTLVPAIDTDNPETLCRHLACTKNASPHPLLSQRNQQVIRPDRQSNRVVINTITLFVGVPRLYTITPRGHMQHTMPARPKALTMNTSQHDPHATLNSAPSHPHVSTTNARPHMLTLLRNVSTPTCYTEQGSPPPEMLKKRYHIKNVHT